MIRTTPRRSRRLHRCETCSARIVKGDSYLEHVASPRHDGLANPGWWRMAECAECASRNGRGVLLVGMTP